MKNEKILTEAHRLSAKTLFQINPVKSATSKTGVRSSRQRRFEGLIPKRDIAAPVLGVLVRVINFVKVSIQGWHSLVLVFLI